ncbi:uncharacterized protein LAJ45_03810 [Morchella importuna]|uniref:uncharacterized protein n=1 Tax=Morchella importuna TaxID=1174673 RepID=UPI001E8E01FD|nr:uncharacterized protein LAJ45_03810 [Morchella importuna]KAH8151819.1 hypothetical protein LAJ45_03810 [Morchella importuna]
MMGSTPRALPTGGCNFRDLAQAGIALTCGCQNFGAENEKGEEKSQHQREEEGEEGEEELINPITRGSVGKKSVGSVASARRRRRRVTVFENFPLLLMMTATLTSLRRIVDVVITPVTTPLKELPRSLPFLPILNLLDGVILFRYPTPKPLCDSTILHQM